MSNVADSAEQAISGFKIQFDRERHVLLATFAGQVDFALMRTALAKTREFSRGRDVRCAIADFSGIKRFAVNSGDIHMLAEEPPVFDSQIPRVTVGSSDHVFGMARMFEMLSEGRRTDVHVVRTIEEAYTLLRLENPQFEDIDVG